MHRQALLLAAVFELLGALLLGRHMVSSVTESLFNVSEAVAVRTVCSKMLVVRERRVGRDQQQLCMPADAASSLPSY